MCVKVALCSLGNTLTTPRNQDTLGQARVGVLELSKGELDATVGELIKELVQLTLSSSLDLEYTLLARVLLEGTCEWSLD